MLPGSGTVLVVMVRVPKLPPQSPTQLLTLKVPSDLQPFSTSPVSRLKNLVDVEMKPNSARFSPRLSVGSLFKSPENEPPVIAPVNSYCAS